MTRSLDDKLPGDETQGVNLHVSKYGCKSTPKYG